MANWRSLRDFDDQSRRSIARKLLNPPKTPDFLSGSNAGQRGAYYAQRLEIESSSGPDKVEEVEQPFIRRRSSRVASRTTKIDDDSMPTFEENVAHVNESNFPSNEIREYHRKHPAARVVDFVEEAEALLKE